MNSFCFLKNACAMPYADVPAFSFVDFRIEILYLFRNTRCRLLSFSALPEGPDSFTLLAILADPDRKGLLLGKTTVGKSYESFTKDLPLFQWFEREIFEETNLLPEGHPNLKPIRFSHGGEPGVTDYFTMHGDASHEVAVGPVHAGVIEPGHFRFQCMGEDVFSLEIELGYQHRGIEKMLKGGPNLRTVHLIETAAGDTSAAAAFNYANILEALSGEPALPERVKALRILALELERIANHTGDLGALAGDAAFLPTSSFCGRIRGEFLNMTAMLCGNRFGRGFIRSGTLAYDLEKEDQEKLLVWFLKTRKDLEHALKLMFDSPSVLDRLENTGSVSQRRAEETGLVGIAGRASGLSLDARMDLPLPGYEKYYSFRIPVAGSGDVFARALIRRKELEISLDIVQDLLEHLPDGAIPEEKENPFPAKNSIICSVCEAWRGELVHVCITDDEGKFAFCKITDPSFHNWFGLALALRDEQISNFPLCNKSFNLSYCGHDL